MVTTEITLEEASLLAEREIARQIAATPALSSYQFSSVRLKREDERAWVFVSGSAQLQEEGYVPGALYARVDKQDGHIWQPEELADYLERQLAAEPSETQNGVASPAGNAAAMLQFLRENRLPDTARPDAAEIEAHIREARDE